MAHLKLIPKDSHLPDEQTRVARAQLPLPPLQQMRLAEEGGTEASIAVGERGFEPAGASFGPGRGVRFVALQFGDPCGDGDQLPRHQAIQVSEFSTGQILARNVAQQVPNGVDPQSGEFLGGALPQHRCQRCGQLRIRPSAPTTDRSFHS